VRHPPDRPRSGTGRCACSDRANHHRGPWVAAGPPACCWASRQLTAHGVSRCAGARAPGARPLGKARCPAGGASRTVVLDEQAADALRPCQAAPGRIVVTTGMLAALDEEGRGPRCSRTNGAQPVPPRHYLFTHGRPRLAAARPNPSLRPVACAGWSTRLERWGRRARRPPWSGTGDRSPRRSAAPALAAKSEPGPRRPVPAVLGAVFLPAWASWRAPRGGRPGAPPGRGPCSPRPRPGTYRCSRAVLAPRPSAALAGISGPDRGQRPARPALPWPTPTTTTDPRGPFAAAEGRRNRERTPRVPRPSPPVPEGLPAPGSPCEP